MEERGGLIVCVASGIVAALVHGWAPTEAREEHRSEMLACVLCEFGVPLPWGVAAAATADFTAETFGMLRWAGESLVAGLFLPPTACAAILLGVAIIFCGPTGARLIRSHALRALV